MLQGSLRRTGNRVLLDVSLVDTQDGHALWAERYDRTIADSITLQGELAAAIVEGVAFFCNVEKILRMESLEKNALTFSKYHGQLPSFTSATAPFRPVSPA